MEVAKKEVGFNKSAGGRLSSDRELLSSNGRYTSEVLEQTLTQPFIWVSSFCREERVMLFRL